jgi:hypothetical protein
MEASVLCSTSNIAIAVAVCRSWLTVVHLLVVVTVEAAEIEGAAAAPAGLVAERMMRRSGHLAPSWAVSCSRSATLNADVHISSQ